MSLTLKIVSYQRNTPSQEECFSSELNRFSVGRGSDNHWTLPDPQRFMSGTHCWFENRNGAWFITDTSTNGVFLNKSDQRMTKNEAVEIRQGDGIRIGDYDLEVEIAPAQAGQGAPGIAQPDFSANPFGSDLQEPASADIMGGIETMEPELEDILGGGEAAPLTPPQGDEPAFFKDVNTPLSEMDNSLLGDSLSIDDLYNLDEDEEEVAPPTLAEKGDQGPVLTHNFDAPETRPATAADTDSKYGLDLSDIPENWDDDSGVVETPVAAKPAVPEPSPPPAKQSPVPPPAQEAAKARPEPTPPSAPAPKPTPARSAAAPVAAGSVVESFARGAGIEPAQLHITDESEFLEELGGLFKIMTEGLMQVIASRNQIKSEFRLEQTMIAPTANNPFKFSASAHEAMTRLFNSGDRAYLSGLEATEEAVDDISAHQMAVVAGTEAALRDILQRFQPEKLEGRFSKNKSSLLGKALPALEKARCWDFYKVLYQEVSEAADDDFQQLFGSEFSNAYESQLERLKLARRESSE